MLRRFLKPWQFVAMILIFLGLEAELIWTVISVARQLQSAPNETTAIALLALVVIALIVPAAAIQLYCDRHDEEHPTSPF